MIKILFVGRSLNTGGIERALVNQLLSMDREKYDISLYLFANEGVYLKELPSNINVIFGNKLLNCMSMTKEESKKNIITFFIRNLMALIAKIVGSRKLYHNVFKTIRLKETYDCAISYQTDGDDHSLYYGCSRFVIEKVKARKKIAWLHSDYMFMLSNLSIDQAIYKQFDFIVNVSDTMKNKFDKLNVVDCHKSLVVYNRIPVEDIKKSAMQKNDLKKSEFMLATVARMDKLKSVYELCETAKVLNDRGLNFKWYFIGKGPEFERCGAFVRKHYLEDRIVFVGEEQNPYTYMKKADLFISGSVLETFGLSIAEALALNTPVIALKFEAIEEVLENGVNGIIVEDFAQMADIVEKCIQDSLFYEKLKEKAVWLKDYNQMNGIQFDYIFK